jgi:preprotein translocase subunit SecE
VGAFLQELFRTGLYKRSQGRIARQVTFAALWIIVALGAWRMNVWFADRGYSTSESYAIPLTVFAIGSWAAFRVVQLPQFADFLISVEGEMNKVTWPKRSELFRASIVVMLLIFVLAAILYLYDLLWQTIFGPLLG